MTHSHDPEHQLLAHLFFTAAAFKGITEAKHLAATSLDRYLMFSGKTSLFGTTFQIPYKGWHHDVSADMNDSLRSSFCIPPLKRLDQVFERESRVLPRRIPDMMSSGIHNSTAVDKLPKSHRVFKFVEIRQ